MLYLLIAYTNLVFVLLCLEDTFDSIIWRTTEIIRLVIHHLWTAQPKHTPYFSDVFSKMKIKFHTVCPTCITSRWNFLSSAKSLIFVSSSRLYGQESPIMNKRVNIQPILMLNYLQYCSFMNGDKLNHLPILSAIRSDSPGLHNKSQRLGVIPLVLFWNFSGQSS